MTTDLAAELMRRLLMEAMLLAAPVLLVAMSVSFLLSLAQTLTSLQDQTISTVPRLALSALVIVLGVPWFFRHLVSYTTGLLMDLHHYLG